MFGLFRTDHPTNAWDIQTHTKFYYFKHLDVPHQYTRPIKQTIDRAFASAYKAVTEKVVREVESRPFLDKTWIKVMAIVGAGAFFPVLNMTGILPYVAGYLLPPLAILLVVYQFCSSRSGR